MEYLKFITICFLSLGLMFPLCAGWVTSYNHKLHHHGFVCRQGSNPRTVITTTTTTTTALRIGPQQLGEFETLCLSQSPQQRQVQFFDFVSSGELVDFEAAWDFQKKILGEHVERLSQEDSDSSSQFCSNQPESRQLGLDTVIMLEHHPVYTLGTGSDENFVLAGNDNQTPVVRMDRGGEVHCHCPGQLTMYGIFDLRGYRQDIHWYMRALEEAIILALSKCGIDYAERQDDITGVWVRNCKVAAVGIKCRKWVTMHGLSVNIGTESLAHFSGIVPCGLVGRDVGCLNQFLETPTTVADFSILLKDAIEEVFQIKLMEPETRNFLEAAGKM